MGIAACGSKIRSDPGRYTAAKVRSMHVMQSNSPTVLIIVSHSLSWLKRRSNMFVIRDTT